MHIPEDLQRLIRTGKLLVVVGAGVSAAATENEKASTWKGLLELGIVQCTQYGSTRLDGSSASDLKRMLETNDLDSWLAVATLIERKLRYPHSREWANWIAETVGSLKIRSSSLIEAIFALGTPIVTTNYDRLLSDVRLSQFRQPIDWEQDNFDSLFHKNPMDYILHLHGCATNPSGIVLGVHSYSKILADDKVQTFLKGLLSHYGLLFIGFGSGYRDPNFAPLFEFIKTYGGVHRNFALVRNADSTTFDAVDNVYALAFGDHNHDLPMFVRSLPYGQERLVYSSGYSQSEYYAPGDTFFDVSVAPEMTFIPPGSS